MYATALYRGSLINPALRSSEFYEDNEFTTEIDIADIQTGDFLGLCRKDKKDLYGIHMAMAVILGESRYVLHNVRHLSHAVIQPLELALEYKDHEKIAWAKRPTTEAPELANYDLLRSQGFWYILPSGSGR